MFSVFLFIFFNALLSFPVFSSRFDWLSYNRFYFMVDSQLPFHGRNLKKQITAVVMLWLQTHGTSGKPRGKSNMTFSMWVFELDES